MMDKDDEPMYPSIWRPVALEKKLNKGVQLDEFMV